MGSSLFTVVEVDPSQRIRCQAPGCVKTVYKRIHVVHDGDRIVVVGSDCWARLYAHAPGTNGNPQHGDSHGRILTPEERALLQENTIAFVARMEQEAAEAAAHAEAERRLESERRQATLGERARWQARAFDPDDPPYVASTHDEGARRADRNALERYRAQEAHRVARDLIARAPEFERFPERWIARAMVRAKEDCIASGVKLDEPGLATTH